MVANREWTNKNTKRTQQKSIGHRIKVKLNKQMLRRPVPARTKQQHDAEDEKCNERRRTDKSTNQGRNNQNKNRNNIRS